MKNKIYSLILILIILSGLFLRLYQLNRQSYWIDEAFTLNAVLSTLENGYPLLDSGEYYGRAILNTYLISASVSLFGFNEFSTRITSVIFGILTIYLIFLISKKIFNKHVALLATFMTSFSYWQIAWSRQARMYAQLQFFFFLSIYLFNSLLEKFSYKKLFFLFLSTLGAILTHYFGYFLFIIYFIVILYKIYQDENLKNKIYQEIKKKYILFLTLFIISLPIFYKVATEFFHHIIIKNNNYFLAYLFFIKNFFPILYILAILGVIILFINNYKNKEKLEKILLLFISFIIPFIFIATISDRRILRYVFFIIPILFIFSSYFIYYISQKTRNKNLVFIILSILIIILINNLNVRVFNFIPKSHYYLEPLTPQANFKQAYKEIEKNGVNEDTVVISPYPAMDRIYLGKSDYCLFINLSGEGTVEENKNKRDYYSNAINIFSKNELEKIIENNKGYIIIDYMATNNRLNQEIIDFVFKQELIFKDEYKFNNQIWVFKF